MKTISKLTPSIGASAIDRPTPICGDHEVMIKVLATSICGTDVHIYDYNPWAQSRIKTPQILGHELAGKVIEVGQNVSSVKRGDIVACETHIVCGHCEFCLNDQKHLCRNTQILGVDRDGAFAEYVVMPAENCWVSDSNVDPAYLCIQEPLGNAIHTVASGEVNGKSVAIVGVGPIGLMAVDVAKTLGAKWVVAVDVNDYRLDLAKEVGADLSINAKDQDPVKTILDLTDQYGVDVVCEMSGNARALTSAFSYLKKGGRMSILGLPDGPVSIDINNAIVFKGITIHGITGRKMMQTWAQGKQLIDSGKLHLDRIVTHILPFDQFEEGFTLMHEGRCGKVVLRVAED
jgi:threonine 3-dehydrogenase